MSAVTRTNDVWAPVTGLRYPTPRSVQFVDADDFLRLALQAHIAAARALVPPPGERWIDPEFDLAWSSPEDFMRELLHHLGERLRRHAIAKRHLSEVPWTADEVAEQEAFEAEMPELMARLSGASNGVAAGAGRSPAAEGHGCPALSPAVGPALGEASASDITSDANPLFFAQEVQELPVDLPRPHTHPEAEETQC